MVVCMFPINHGEPRSYELSFPTMIDLLQEASIDFWQWFLNLRFVFPFDSSSLANMMKHEKLQTPQFHI